MRWELGTSSSVRVQNGKQWLRLLLMPRWHARLRVLQRAATGRCRCLPPLALSPSAINTPYCNRQRCDDVRAPRPATLIHFFLLLGYAFLFSLIQFYLSFPILKSIGRLCCFCCCANLICLTLIVTLKLGSLPFIHNKLFQMVLNILLFFLSWSVVA